MVLRLKIIKKEFFKMTVVTKTKTISFYKLIPDFKRFVARKGSPRQILTYMYYDKEYLTATDSHVMFRVNAEYIDDIPTDNNFFYDPREKEIVDPSSNYPQTNRLVPSDGNTICEIDDLKDLYNKINEANKTVKSNHNRTIKLDITDEGTNLYEIDYKLSRDEDGAFYIKEEDKKENFLDNINIPKEGEDISIKFSALYMKKALQTAKKLDKLSDDPIQISINGSMRPIHIKKGDIFDVIVMPVRLK
jgi:hypothetical protein